MTICYLCDQMNMLQQTMRLLWRDWILEWRTRYALSGIVLYVLATIVLVYSALIDIQPKVWNAIFWVIILFAAVSAIVKSFVQESQSRQLYYYNLVHPLALLLAKMIYNTSLLFLLSLLSWGALALLTGNPVKETGLFILAIFLGSMGLSIAFTFVSAISAKAQNSATLMAILGFPVIIPILLTLVKIGANALRLIQDTSISSDILILVAINLVLLSVSILLYPFLWRD
ncbi:heme exporter protein CcmB [Lewinella cohaerens]|uniref:heme exporter protein CcmB n=2 Tax=Lewinella TaxID=70994 RepID=UPI00037F6258|nr:heme exporter protein CcmB [Lewinella cohaerens]